MGGVTESITKYLIKHPNWQIEEPSLHYLTTRCIAINVVGGYMLIDWSAYNKSDNADLITIKEEVKQNGDSLFLVANSLFMFETFTPQVDEIETWLKKNYSLYKVNMVLEKGISLDTLLEEIRDDLKLCNKVVLPYLVIDLIKKNPGMSKENLNKRMEKLTEEEKKRRSDSLAELKQIASELRKKANKRKFNQ